jgi:N6-adenosine-specific RNA methylase IME4
MLEIKEEFKKLIPALTAEEFKQLEQNCLDEGIREKIITWNGFIIDGHNRYEIATRWNLDYQTESKYFKNENDVKEWMINNQFGRRNLSNYQRSVLALQLEEVFSSKAKENLKVSGENFGKGLQISAEPIAIKPINTRKEVAKVANVSHDTIAKVKKIEAVATPEVKAQLSTGELSINQAYQEIKKEEKKEERLQKIELIKESIEKENKTLEGVFDVIAIDPPWEYSERGGFSSEQHDEDSNRGGVDYPTLTVEELKLLKLPSKDDCVLYLWTTHAFLRDSFDLLNAWGFTYKAVITWDKEKMGIGRNIRMQCEFCLLATKGNPLLQGSSVRDIIREPRREHSRKPIKFYELVETMTTGRKLDYFSREKRENWEVYGAESEKF